MTWSEFWTTPSNRLDKYAKAVNRRAAAAKARRDQET